METLFFLSLSPTLSNFSKFNQWCIKNKIKLYISWPATVFVNEYKDDKYQQYFNNLVSYFEKNNINILGHPNDFLFRQSLFYDTNYHLNDQGMTIRTKQMIELLKKNVQLKH
jgi:hypothetical protein